MRGGAGLGGDYRPEPGGPGTPGPREAPPRPGPPPGPPRTWPEASAPRRHGPAEGRRRGGQLQPGVSSSSQCSNDTSKCAVYTFSSGVNAIQEWYKLHYMNIMAQVPLEKKINMSYSAKELLVTCFFDGVSCDARSGQGGGRALPRLRGPRLWAPGPSLCPELRGLGRGGRPPRRP